MSQSTVIARIGKPHGLLGEVTVQLHTDEPERRLVVGTVIDTEATSGTGVPHCRLPPTTYAVAPALPHSAGARPGRRQT